MVGQNGGPECGREGKISLGEIGRIYLVLVDLPFVKLIRKVRWMTRIGSCSWEGRWSF